MYLNVNKMLVIVCACKKAIVFKDFTLVKHLQQLKVCDSNFEVNIFFKF